MAEAAVKTVLDAVTDGKKKEKDTLEPKEFFWDQFVKYISSAILALTILNVTVEFFRDGGVSCFHPADTAALISSAPGMAPLAIYEFARDQATFLNRYCIGSIPTTEYFPVFILVHGLLLVAPHFIWSSIYKGDFDSFFSIAGKIDRLRNSTTGEYSEDNFDRVKKLEIEYGGENRRIFDSYIGKLCIQFVVCAVSIGLSAGWLKDFSFSFVCPRELDEEGVIPDEWPLNMTVPCVYTSLRILAIVRVVDFILTGLAAVLILYGIFWCVVRHTQQLGHQEVAKFAFQSCLKSDLYEFPPIIRFGGRDFLKRIQKDYEIGSFVKYLLWPLAHKVHSFGFRNCFNPGIRNDLDFLLLTLFRADASHGKVFKDIQVNKELKRLVGRDHQLLHLYINVQQDMLESQNRKNYQSHPSPSSHPSSHPSSSSSSALTQRVSQHALGSDPASPRLENGGRGNEDDNAPSQDGCLTRCCASCITKFLCCCCLRKKAKLKVNNVAKPHMSEQERRRYQDFRAIFAESGFGGNPERVAFAFFGEHLGNLEYQGESLHGMRDMIYSQVCLNGRSQVQGSKLSNNVAVDISFGTIGYALVLSRLFKAVYSVNFHPYYRATGGKVVNIQEYFTNYSSVTYPDDIYTRSNVDIVPANMKILKPLVELKEEKNKPVDMILVGPVSQEQHKISINLFLNFVNSRECIGEGALLLAIRPLRIGSEKVSSYKYEPSYKLFKKITGGKRLSDEQEKACRYVDGQRGYKVVCGGVTCIIEFEAYKFCGAEEEKEEEERRGEEEEENSHHDNSSNTSVI